MLQEAGHIKKYSCFDYCDFPAYCIQCLHSMFAEVAWVLASLGTQIQPQLILNLDYISIVYVKHPYVQFYVSAITC